ncbi:hypothetical protein NBRC116594_19090 [Shimia sp. NS0008-38b]|uniref:hypothetical protein n=1 Tax=Shimia sp. NS0008-38b TaxID=3127653 RepID=UPI00310B3F99
MILATICLIAAIGVAWTKSPTDVVRISLESLGFLALLSPKIFCGFFIAAAVPILIPPDQLAHWVGKDSGPRGVVVVSFAGALIPGGPTMIFPLAANFRLAGASTATLISFVTAWNLLGVNRTVIWEISFLPIEFVTLRVLLCLPVPILVGFAAHRIFR